MKSNRISAYYSGVELGVGSQTSGWTSPGPHPVPFVIRVTIKTKYIKKSRIYGERERY